MNSKERHEIRYQRRVAARQAKRTAYSESFGRYEDVFSYEHLYQAGKNCCKGVMWKNSTQSYIIGTNKYHESCIFMKFFCPPKLSIHFCDSASEKVICLCRMAEKEMLYIYSTIVKSAGYSSLQEMAQRIKARLT